MNQQNNSSKNQKLTPPMKKQANSDKRQTQTPTKNAKKEQDQKTSNHQLSEEEKTLSDFWSLLQAEKLSDNYVIGKHRVLFGYRIRVVENTDPKPLECKIDWCCAKNHTATEVYSRFLKTLVRTSKLKDKVLDLLPIASEIKPVFLDDKFNDTINKISEEHGGICIIKEIRNYLKQMDY